MANAFRTTLAPLVRNDGAWIRCAAPDCDAYWGAFRPTAHVLAKAQAHAAKAHGVNVRRAAGLRPQRRAAAAQGAPAGLLAVITAFVDAHVGGAQRLGRGVSREVFPFGPEHVLKIAHDPSQGHNGAEAKAWETAPANMRRLLAPVLAVDPAGKWLLMQAATRVGECTQREADRLGNDLGNRIGDLHPANIGWLDGRWVAIDYAGGWAAREVRW
jgi:hypothetical protein